MYNSTVTKEPRSAEVDSLRLCFPLFPLFFRDLCYSGFVNETFYSCVWYTNLLAVQKVLLQKLTFQYTRNYCINSILHFLFISALKYILFFEDFLQLNKQHTKKVSLHLKIHYSKQIADTDNTEVLPRFKKTLFYPTTTFYAF